MPYTWTCGRNREELPIDDHLAQIVQLVRNNQVIIVEAETGAGKTTRLPQALLEAFPNSLLWMTQPRRNAVRWNGQRIAFEMGVKIGGLVGWRLFKGTQTSSETRLQLMVDQSMVNEIRRRGGQIPGGILIIDEAHLRSVQSDMLLGLIKEALSFSTETKVVVMSATIDTQKFSEFFDGAPVVSIQGRCFPVDRRVVRLLRSEHHSEGAFRQAETRLKEFFQGNLTIPTADGSGKQVVKQGAIAVLLAGREDITKGMIRLRTLAAELQNIKDYDRKAAVLGRVEILECHGDTSAEQDDLIQAELRPGTIRFVYSTEVLRTSVTVPYLIGIIDSLQVKRFVTDTKGVGHLKKVPISKAEAIQAEGRAGRMSPGFYDAISFKYEYENLPLFPEPAVLREPLTKTALEVAAVGRSIRNFSFIDPPDLSQINIALRRLRLIGAVDRDEKITEAGEMLVRFPLAPETANALLKASELGVLQEVQIVSAILEGEGIFFYPRESDEPFLVNEGVARLILTRFSKIMEGQGVFWEKLQTPRSAKEVDLSDLPSWMSRHGELFKIDPQKKGGDAFLEEGARTVATLIRQQYAGSDQSDFAAAVRAYRAFEKEKTRIFRLNPTPEVKNNEVSRWREQKLRKWCVERFLNLKNLLLAELKIEEIQTELREAGFRSFNRDSDYQFDGQILTQALVAGLIDNLALEVYEGVYQAPIGEFRLGRQSACPAGAELILVSGVRKVPVQAGKTFFFNLATIAAPVDPKWLLKVAPGLTREERGFSPRFDAENDGVVSTTRVFFNDEEVGIYEQADPDHPEASRLFAVWLATEILK